MISLSSFEQAHVCPYSSKTFEKVFSGRNTIITDNHNIFDLIHNFNKTGNSTNKGTLPHVQWYLNLDGYVSDFIQLE